MPRHAITTGCDVTLDCHRNGCQYPVRRGAKARRGPGSWVMDLPHTPTACAMGANSFLQEIQNAYHTNALLVKILLSQAQTQSADLFVDTNALENELLLRQVGTEAGGEQRQTATARRRVAGLVGWCCCLRTTPEHSVPPTVHRHRCPERLTPTNAPRLDAPRPPVLRSAPARRPRCLAPPRTSFVATPPWAGWGPWPPWPPRCGGVGCGAVGWG
jgi:hypothetical protein